MRQHPRPLTTNLLYQEGANGIMPVSKRTRYEVLKRDNHTCRYCGSSAPDVKLTVDHVTPTALGGTDKPDNLVAACVDCNAGKASTSPDADLVAQVGEDDMRWAAAIKRAADGLIESARRESERHDWFLLEWRDWDEDCSYLSDGWDKSIDHWIGAGLPRVVLLQCLGVALESRSVAHDAVFAYMGGVARRKIEQLHDEARKILDAEGQPGGGA